MRTIKRFLRDETAATAIEYGLIAAGISLAIIAIVNGLGARLNTKFTAINTSAEIGPTASGRRCAGQSRAHFPFAPAAVCVMMTLPTVCHMGQERDENQT